MTRWQRFLWGNLVMNFSNEDGAVGEAVVYNRRATDKITKAMIKKEANNGESTKELVVRYHYENKIEHGKIKTTQGWHGKIIWGIFVIIFLSIVTGAIGLGYWLPKFILNNLIGG